MCVLFASLHKSSLRCPLYFLYLVHSWLLPTLSRNSQVLSLPQPKIFGLYFAISSQRTFISFFNQPIIFLSLSFFFFLKLLQLSIFFLSWCKRLRGNLYWYLYSHHKGNIYFWGCVAQLLSLRWKNKTKQTLLSPPWNLFNESLLRMTGWGSGKYTDLTQFWV